MLCDVQSSNTLFLIIWILCVFFKSKFITSMAIKWTEPSHSRWNCVCWHLVDNARMGLIQNILPNRHGRNGPIFKNLVLLESSCHIEVSFTMQIWVWPEWGAKGAHPLNFGVNRKLIFLAHLLMYKIFIQSNLMCPRHVSIMSSWGLGL